MEEEGTVSLWLGNTDSLDSLERLLAISYPEEEENEDIINSAFATGFHIDFYDDDFLEIEFLEDGCDKLDELLESFSYADILIPKFDRLIGSIKRRFNAVVLLYNFRYSGAIEEWQKNSTYLRFFGSVL